MDAVVVRRQLAARQMATSMLFDRRPSEPYSCFSIRLRLSGVAPAAMINCSSFDSVGLSGRRWLPIRAPCGSVRISPGKGVDKGIMDLHLPPWRLPLNESMLTYPMQACLLNPLPSCPPTPCLPESDFLRAAQQRQPKDLAADVQLVGLLRRHYFAEVLAVGADHMQPIA